VSGSVRTRDVDAVDSDVAVAVGTALSGVAMAGTILPLRRGQADEAVTAAVVFGVLALAVFLGRRYDVVGRRQGAPIAGAASLAVVLLSGYALNQGVTADVAIGSLSFPAVFGVLLAGGGALGMAAADYAGVTGGGLKRRAAIAGGMTVVGVLGLLATIPSTLVLSIPAFVLLGGEFSALESIAIAQLAMAFGMGGVAVGYVWLRGDGLSFIDLRRPTLRDVVWTVGGVFVLFGALIAISLVLSSAGVESADHGTAEQAQQNPEILYVLIPASLLIIGPFEELLYRNVIQKSLYDVFSRAGAIVVASVIFAGVHFLAYWTTDVGAVLASLGVVFGLSLVLGAIYERTENLLVPALVHGIYNAILFAGLYFSVA